MTLVHRSDADVARRRAPSEARQRRALATTSPQRKRRLEPPPRSYTTEPGATATAGYLPAIGAVAHVYALLDLKPSCADDAWQHHSRPSAVTPAPAPRSRRGHSAVLPPLHEKRTGVPVDDQPHENHHGYRTYTKPAHLTTFVAKSVHVLRQRLVMAITRHEREEREEVELREKQLFVALHRRLTAARVAVGYAVDSKSAGGKQAPDTALLSSSALAQGSPVRSRRLNGGVGLGIGGLVNGRLPPLKATTMADGHDASHHIATVPAAMYKQHDLRPAQRRTAARHAHYDHPVAANAQVAIIQPTQGGYEGRLVQVREFTARCELEAKCDNRWRWIVETSEREHAVALERAKVGRACLVNANRKRREAIDEVIGAVIGAALDQHGHFVALAEKTTTDIIKNALRQSRQPSPAPSSESTAAPR